MLLRYCHTFRDFPPAPEGSLSDNTIVLSDVQLSDGNYNELSVEVWERSLKLIYPECVLSGVQDVNH